MRQPRRSHSHRRGIGGTSGQAVFSEYMMVIFLVVGALVAITVYVQRGLQARIHDARNYMIDSVVNNSVCDANCVAAAGGNIAYEYEPYYTQTSASVQQFSNQTSGSGKGSGSSQEGVYYQIGNEATQQSSTGVQLPTECVGSGGPPCCYTSPPSC